LGNPASNPFTIAIGIAKSYVPFPVPLSAFFRVFRGQTLDGSGKGTAAGHAERDPAIRFFIDPL
jgi:hypothetical protein